MNCHVRIRQMLLAVCFGGCLIGSTTGVNCGGGIPGAAPLIPPVAGGNHPPRVQITSILSESGDNFAEAGESVNIGFAGEDGEDEATVRVFASQQQNQQDPNAVQIPISGGVKIGPGPGTGQARWDTTGVAVGSYFIFAEIDDGVNDSVLTTGFTSVQIAPPGSRPQNDPPNLVFLEPVANLGVSSQDLVTLRYVYSDTDSQTTVTLLLDKDQDPTNDDINNPGDPLDPNTNIILLPSESRKTTDPTFDGDPPPPDDPNNPPGQADSLDIRANPRTLGQTAPGIRPPEAPNSPIPGEFKEYIFTVDFSKIPVRSQPYFIRATIKDERQTVHRYAVGSLTITRLASGLVDAGSVGFSIAGGRFQGFSAGENLGSELMSVPDIDGDGLDELIIVGRFASPRNRFLAGAAYLLFGRRKTPFPLDTDGDGLPDVIDGSGNIVNFPPAPPFLPNPYDARNVGRFGGIHSINSVASFFRGTTYGMPEPHSENLPPETLRDPNRPGVFTSGLTSVTRMEVTGDTTPDLIFGIPYVSGALDYHDDDPVDGGCDLAYGDGFPNAANCSPSPAQNDNIFPSRARGIIDQGMVLMVDGTNDIANIFRQFTDAAMAGQFDPFGAVDDEGRILSAAQTPVGCRIRGGWIDNTPPIVSDNEYGRTVAATASLDNDTGDDLLISVPGFQRGRGRVDIWVTNNFLSPGFYGDAPVLSLPAYVSFDCTPGTPSSCVRGFVARPLSLEITGAQAGDRFGYAGPAGTFNQDGVLDIMAGAPGADRFSGNDPNGAGSALTDNGIFYVFFTPAGGFGNTNLTTENPPRLEVRGTHNGDRLGGLQTVINDINGDAIGDIAFASETFDDDILGNTDAGYVGVIFGNRPLTGENGFSPDDVGTPQLAGVRFLGATVAARAGHDIASAGDFNRDGFGDLLIASPGERRDVNVGDTDGDGLDNIEIRLGVAYLVFGGTHLYNQTFNLSQVGNPELPGIVFVSRFVLGSEDQAEIETVGGLGDIDGDGFDDIAFGTPKADFVDPASPDQRRLDTGEAYIVYGNNFGSNKLGG
ncbi:MAG: hypothetical protein ACE5F9_05400 [Phycisphaerae bacterium]